jgi:uncharacterized protein YfbU (UPF0304 family)
MDENSLEPCGPTVADVGCRFEMWRTGYPISPLLNAVCFAWPATTLAVKHDASRLMARTISTVKSSVKRWLGSKPRHSGTGRDADELAGTTKDKIIRKIFSSRVMQNCDTISFAVIDDTRSACIFDSSEPAPPEVNEVVNFLDMWSFIEEAYGALGPAEKADLEHKAAPFGESPRFTGFDGNNECEYMGIAGFLIRQLDRFVEFKDRDLNSHLPSVAGYRRMYETFEPIRRTLFDRRMSVDELAKVLNARRYRPGE